MIRELLDRLPKKTFYGTTGPYLTRWKLLDFGKSAIRVYVHLFHRSDEDRELHSHPWDWAVALVLRGGYREDRRDGARVRRPGAINVLRHDTYHRVELLSTESWSLFIAGPERTTWYFMDPITGEGIPWRDHLRRKGLTPLEH